ncbi:MAG: hypothetical protein RLP09_30135 [Sandaracinaceae bacterium]
MAQEARRLAEEYREQGLPAAFIESQEMLAESLDATAHEYEPDEVLFAFTGDPVKGHEGVSAGFLGEMLQSITKAVRKTMATVPSSNENDEFFVTGTSAGSFGIVLKDLSSQQSLVDSPIVESARLVARSIGAVAQENDQLFDELFDQHTSLKGVLTELLVRASNWGAGVKIRGAAIPEEESVSLDTKQVSRAAERLNEIGESEEEEIVYGLLMGMLPVGRVAEIQTGRSRVFRVEISEDIDTDDLQAAVGKKCRLLFRKTVWEYPSGYTRTTRVLLDATPVGDATEFDFES